MPCDGQYPERYIPEEFHGKWRETAHYGPDVAERPHYGPDLPEQSWVGAWEITATIIATRYDDLFVASVLPLRKWLPPASCLVRFENNPIVLHLYRTANPRMLGIVWNVYAGEPRPIFYLSSAVSPTNESLP